MQILECPNCGSPISDDDISSEHQQLILAAGQVVAAAAVVGLLLEDPSYISARPGFKQRLRDVTEGLRQTAEDLGTWGEAFDESDGED